MTLSLGELYEAMLQDRAQKSPLMDSGLDTGAMQVVRAGLELRPEGETSFWDEFIQLLSNSEGVAELLGVSPEKISGWPHRITKALEQIEQQQEPSQEEDDAEMVPTGDNGAFTAMNQDPSLGAAV